MKNLLQRMQSALMLVCFSIVFLNANATMHVVHVQNYLFDPQSMTFPLGDSVRWVWVSGTHNTTSTSVPAGAASWASNISPNVTTFTYVPTVVGTYQYHCTLHSTMVAYFVVTCPTPTPNISSGNGGTSLPCFGSTVVLSVTNAQPNWTYQWKLNGNNIQGATNSTYSTTTGGSFTCAVTNSCGTSATSNTVGIQFASQVTVYVTPPTSTICPGTTQTLVATIGSTPTGTYTWTPATGLNTTTGSTVIATPQVTTSYTVIATNANGCSGYAIATVTVNPGPTQQFIQANGPTTFCQGSGVTLVCSSTSGYTYQWYRNSVAIAGATSNSYYANATGSFACLVSNSCGTSVTTNAISCTRNLNPTVTTTPVGPVSMCQGSFTNIYASSAGATSYQWIMNNVNIAGANLNYYHATMAGNYKVMVTNANGCTKKSAVTQLTINCREAGDLVNTGVYPNPFSSNFSIDLNDETTVRIMDLTGKTISEQIVSEGTFTYGETLMPGVYFISLSNSNGETSTYKLIKTD